jgi:phosphatidylinositol alpha-mannosyltransferase
MKIALVSPYDIAYPGGVAVHINQLAEEFANQGHSVKILAPSSKSPGTLGMDNLVNLGTPVPVPGGGSIARISFSLWLMPKVRNLVEGEGFDVIHLHEPFMPILPLQVLHCSQSANVGTFHAVQGRVGNYSWAKIGLQHWMNKLHGRIAVSALALESVRRYFGGDYSVIPNSIDVDHFAKSVAPIPELLDGRINILFVGRLEKRKGLRYLLQAFARLKWDYPELRLLVVGPGNPDKESYRVLGEHNLKDVVFLGGVSYQDLPRYYQAAHIFCSPATGKESQGLVLLEAMAAGKAIVASNIAGYASVLSYGAQGLLVPPRDPLALAEALGYLLDKPALRYELEKRVIVQAQLFRREKIAQQVLSVYEGAITRKLTRPKSAPMPFNP